MVEVDAPVAGDDCTATGHVREVVYLGAVTRYIVALDGGGTLVVLQQNLTTSSMQALQVRGKAVRLTWHRSSSRPRGGPVRGEPRIHGPGGGYR